MVDGMAKAAKHPVTNSVLVGTDAYLVSDLLYTCE